MSVPDEMVDGRNNVRQHWGTLLAEMSSLGWAELGQRSARIAQAVAEDGAAGRHPEGTDPAWGCNPVPMLLSDTEFTALEAGLIQRATLLEAVLADCYGSQCLLADGDLPPALVFANPAFLRAGRPRAPQAGPFLHSYAADVMRSADGAWRVVADRTVGAPGAGYAREIRDLMARFLPELFRTGPVRQLRPFFEAWGDALPRLAPATAGGRPAGVAILTPGTASPHWFEHMILSRELSCPLVEGRDLTVRGGSLFLKTLRGLQPLGLLLRKMDGRMLDPLELAGGSALGVAGLLSAVREGVLRVVNDPGTGAVEAPALGAFLPGLCRRLLGQALALPTLPTMWLGDDASLARVRQNPARWLLRPALDGTAPLIALDQLAGAERQSVIDSVRAKPWDWAATAALGASVAPVLGPDGLRPDPVMLRLFLMHDGERWQVMEGGLAWSPKSALHLGAAFQPGAVLRDVWVFRDAGGQRPPMPAPTRSPMPIRRTVGDLPSRVADDFYWMGRYLERLEGAARLALMLIVRLGRGAPLPRDAAEAKLLLRALIDGGTIEAGQSAEIALAASLHGGPLLAHLNEVARLANALQDRLTTEMHMAFTRALRPVRNGVPDPSIDALGQALTGVVRLSTSMAGLAAENMVRGGGWLFLDLGRRIERASGTARQLACALDQPVQRMESGLHLALELCDSLVTYRHRYLSVVQPGPALDLVLADPDNPRALAFQFAQAARILGQVGTQAAGLDAVAHDLARRIEVLAAGVVAAPDQAAAAASLSAALVALTVDTAAFSDEISRRCFTLLPVSRLLDGAGWDDGAMPYLRGAA